MKYLLPLFIICFFFGCGKSTDKDKIGDAQICLDKLSASPAAAEVDACTEKIAGLTTTAAYTVFCAANFIKEGFGGATRFITAFQQINGGTSGSNVQALMGVMTFTAKANVTLDLADAQSNFSTCLLSTGKGSTLLASFSYLTMALYNFYNSKALPYCPNTVTTTTYSYYDLSSCVTAALADAGPGPGQLATVALIDSNSVDAAAITAQNSIGTIIVAAYGLSCTGTGANANLCATMKTAIDASGGITASPRVIAANFIISSLNIHFP